MEDNKIAELNLALERCQLAMKMAADVMITDSRDWSVNPTDAWLYALLLGWDDAIEEIIQLHGSAMYGANRLGESLRQEREDGERIL